MQNLMFYSAGEEVNAAPGGSPTVKSWQSLLRGSDTVWSKEFLSNPEYRQQVTDYSSHASPFDQWHTQIALIARLGRSFSEINCLEIQSFSPAGDFLSIFIRFLNSPCDADFRNT